MKNGYRRSAIATSESPNRGTTHAGRWLRSLLVLCSGSVLAWAWTALPPTLVRGPYLQSASASGITVVFRTSTAATSVLRYGTLMGPPWQFEVAGPSATTHVFALTNLQPGTRYHYQVSSEGAVLAGGPERFFHTAPPENSRAPLRFLAWGDSGNGSSVQRAVAARMGEVVPAPQLALGLGDLVYDDGAWEDYDPNLFRPYASLFGRTTFWPTIGNHDYKTQNGAPYFDAFYLPTRSGHPSRPSNTEKYYSFDHGMAHFTCIDSESSDSSPGSTMYQWISDDLDNARARGKRWLFAYMHHPPYSAGTHESDEEDELIELHDNLVPLFEAKGVDMVLVGHSHVYERSFLAKNDRVLQSNARDYSKINSPDGTLYIVSGCGGETGDGPLDHPLMSVSRGDVAGFSLIDVTYEELRGSFVEDDGRTTDLFTVHKAVDVLPPRVAHVQASSPTEVELVFDEPVRAGTSGSGAENIAHYTLSRSAVVDATLASDQRTVTLTTTSIPHESVRDLAVAGVADAAGIVGATVQRRGIVLHGQSSSGSGSPPVAVLECSVREANVPAAIPFSARRSFDPDGTELGYAWAFGDGTFGFGRWAQHVYARPGTYTVTLLVRDRRGMDDIAQHTIRVHSLGLAPVARLSASRTSISVGSRVDFNSSGSVDPDGGPLHVQWDFGEPARGPGNVSTLVQPGHVFQTRGAYPVSLAVTDDEGSTSVQFVVIRVN